MKKKKRCEKTSSIPVTITYIYILYRNKVSLDQICRDLDMEKKAVRRIIKWLENNNYIEVVTSENTGEKYYQVSNFQKLANKAEDSLSSYKGEIARFEDEVKSEYYFFLADKAKGSEFITKSLQPKILVLLGRLLERYKSKGKSSCNVEEELIKELKNKERFVHSYILDLETYHFATTSWVAVKDMKEKQLEIQLTEEGIRWVFGVLVWEALEIGKQKQNPANFSIVFLLKNFFLK